MQLNSYCLLVYILFNSQFEYIITKPMEGQNVRNARRTEFPYAVSIIRFQGRRLIDPVIDHICSGTLISYSDVATSDHCLANEIKIPIRVLVGSIDLRQAEKYRIFWWLSFDAWAERKHQTVEFTSNDLTVVRLVEAVPIQITPVEIPNIANPTLYGLQVVAAGWGLINATHVDPILKVVDLYVLTHKATKERLEAIINNEITIANKPNIYTVASPSVSLAYGDSGGPLVYRGQLIGIHEGTCPQGFPDNSPHLINIHASVHYYREFLLDVKC